MPKRKIGTVEPLPSGRYLCRVTRGRRSDGKPRTLYETVDTEEEAEIACARMAARLGSASAYGDSLTLAQYYEGVFRSGQSVRGTARSNATLRDYDSQMRRFVLPAIGGKPLSRITHADVKACVLSAVSPHKCKVALRAVMNAAYADEMLPEKPFTRRIVTPRGRREQVAPWTVPEAMAALAAFRDEAPELEAYLILGLSGFRLEEALGLRPMDIRAQSAYDFATGETTESLVGTIRQTYTDADGLKPKAKNDFSMRDMPILVAGRSRLLALLDAARPMDPEAASSWAASRIVPLRGDTLAKRWRAALEAHGIRRIPPDTLRHTSETLMQAADLPDTLVSRLHGHTDLKTDYRHYMRPGAADAERAARAVHKLMPGAG